MYILAIETTGPVGSVAVIDVDVSGLSGQIPMKITTQSMSHLKNLIPMISELLEEEQIGKDEICAVAASVGPGSFTGIRIGVSTARALAQAWDVPCISVPTLELFRQKCGNGVCVIFNARRGQVYGACYDGAGKVLIEPGPYMLIDMLDRIENLGVEPVFYGDGVDAYFDSEEFRDGVSGYEATPEEERYQTADMTAEYARGVWKEYLAEKREHEAARSETDMSTKRETDSASDDAECLYEHGRVVPYEELLPDYMRENEAEQRLKDGSLEKMRKAKMEKFMKMAGKQF